MVGKVVEAEVELPGGEGREGAGGGAEADPNLNEFGGLDIMPDALVVYLFLRIMMRKRLFGYDIPRELRVLDRR